MLFETNGEVLSDAPLSSNFTCAPPAFMSAITYYPNERRGTCGEEDAEQGVTFYISAESEGPRRRSDCECPDFRTEPDPLAHGLLRKGVGQLNAAVQNGQLQSLSLLLSMNPGDALRWQVSDAHQVKQFRYPPCGSLRSVTEESLPDIRGRAKGGDDNLVSWPDAPYTLTM